MNLYTKDAVDSKLAKFNLYQHCLKITDDNEQTKIYFKIYDNVSTAYSDFADILDSYLPQLNNNSGVVDISGTKTSCYFTDDSTDTLHIFYSNNQNLNYTYGSNITLSDIVVKIQ